MSEGAQETCTNVALGQPTANENFTSSFGTAAQLGLRQGI